MKCWTQEKFGGDSMFSKSIDNGIKFLKKWRLLKRFTLIFVNSYEKIWDFRAITEYSALKSVLTGAENENIFDSSGQKTAEELKRFINPEAMVLDFGCGIGRVDKFLAPYCKELYGIDASRRMIKIAKERLKDCTNVFSIKNNGRDLSIFPNEKFDFVFSIGVLQHVDKDDACFYLVEIFRVLKECGKTYLQFPNFLYGSRPQEYIGYITNPENTRAIDKMRWYTAFEVEEILKAIGFNIVSLTEDKDIIVIASKNMTYCKS